MIRIPLHLRTVTGLGACSPDHVTFCRAISSSHSYSSTIRLLSASRKCRFVCGGYSKKSKSSSSISCSSLFGGFSHESDGDDSYFDEDDDDYAEAVVLVAESISHYRMRTRGFKEETQWQPSLHLGPFSVQTRDPRQRVHSIGSSFLRRFQNPTIFLKVSCDGDYVLPIVVGESAIEKLIDSFHEDDCGECPNQFQLLRNIMEKFGYKVKMVRITEKVVNTYVSRIFFHKPGDTSIFSVDARPSDSINVAKRCKAPLYVHKQIVLADATRISYGLGRMSSKTVYDVSLDSAADGPDSVSEELNMVRNMNLASEEERYDDAVMWRDKLKKLRETKHGP